jgi:hypothetical protein
MHLKNGHFETVNQFDGDDVAFLYRLLQPRSNVALFEKLFLCQQLSTVKKSLFREQTLAYRLACEM